MTTIMRSIFVLLLVATGATLPTSVQGQVSVVGFRDALRTGVAPTVDRYSAQSSASETELLVQRTSSDVTQSQSAAMPLRTETIPPETVVVPQSVEMPGTTLAEVVFLAQTSNPALREASAKVGVAQGNAVQVGLPPNPTFFTSSPQWAGSISQYNWVLGQDYITAGKLGLNRAVAYRSVEQAQLDFTRTRFEVLTNVRRAFYVAAAAQRRNEVLGQLTQVAARTRDVGKKLLQAGEANSADTTLLDIEHDKAEMAYRNSSAMLAAARKQLTATIGVPELDLGSLQFDLTVELPDYEFEALRQGVVDKNAIAAMAVVEIQKSQFELRRAAAEPWPNFNIQAGYQYSVESPRHDQGFGQFTTTLPLWNRNQGGIRSARANTARAQAGLQRVENELSQQAAVALGQYLAATERVKIYEQQLLPKSREVFRVNGSLFEQGQTDFLRLLQAQKTLIEVDLGYVEAQEARLTAAATIAGLLQLEQFP
jgi:cobalt-zinc-cadmium efflux system outer membrane protein